LEAISAHRGAPPDRGRKSYGENQLHAEKSEALPNPGSLGRLGERTKFLNGQEAGIKKDIVELIDTQPEVRGAIKKHPLYQGRDILPQ